MGTCKLKKNLRGGVLYSGNNPLVIGEDGFTIAANTLLKEALVIQNGVESIDYYDTSGEWVRCGTPTLSNTSTSYPATQSLNYGYSTYRLLNSTNDTWTISEGESKDFKDMDLYYSTTAYIKASVTNKILTLTGYSPTGGNFSTGQNLIVYGYIKHYLAKDPM